MHHDDSGTPLHERIVDAAFRRAVDLLDAGDANALRAHLAVHPDVVRRRITFDDMSYFRDPTLLEFSAENPVRRGSLPPTIVAAAKAVLDARGSDDRRSVDSTLALVCSGRVPRECRAQTQLIDLLCDYGADPGGAILPALAHGEFEAVDALLRRGAPMDLAVAAATGRRDEARSLLPTADAQARHVALALAAQHGHADVVRLLLDAGEDANRYNPAGLHAHSVPLHQAVSYGHDDVVRLLVERGADTALTDTVYGGTPLDWANFAGRTEIANSLRARGAKTAAELER
jgi:hypothetical protein